MEKHKFASNSLTVRDRTISSKFSTHRVSKECIIGNFQKKFHLTKNGGHFEFFEFLPKMEKHKFASISLTVLDIVISSKFSTHRISEKCTFYCVNTSYPMDNSLSSRRGPARQTSEKDVLCLHRPGRPSTVHSPDGVSYFLPV